VSIRSALLRRRNRRLAEKRRREREPNVLSPLGSNTVMDDVSAQELNAAIERSLAKAKQRRDERWLASQRKS
jgi:hypothetical protein